MNNRTIAPGVAGIPIREADNDNAPVVADFRRDQVFYDLLQEEEQHQIKLALLDFVERMILARTERERITLVNDYSARIQDLCKWSF